MLERITCGMIGWGSCQLVFPDTLRPQECVTHAMQSVRQDVWKCLQTYEHWIQTENFLIVIKSNTHKNVMVRPRCTHLAGILNDHLPGINVTLAEQPSAMDVGTEHSHRFPGRLSQVAVPHGHGQLQAGGTSEMHNMCVFGCCNPCSVLQLVVTMTSQGHEQLPCQNITW